MSPIPMLCRPVQARSVRVPGRKAFCIERHPETGQCWRTVRFTGSMHRALRSGIIAQREGNCITGTKLWNYLQR
jgi:hypothetical protein